MNRPGRYPPSHPVALFAAQRLRDLGYKADFLAGPDEWMVRSDKVAALDRNIAKAMRSLSSKLLHRKFTKEYDEIRRVLLEIEEI